MNDGPDEAARLPHDLSTAPPAGSPSNETTSVTLTRDPHEFSARAQTFLERRLTCNVLATVLMRVLDGQLAAAPPLFAWLTAQDGTIQGAALRAPPWPMLCSELSPGVAAGLVDRWLAPDPDLDGVGSVPATARALVAAWERRTGGTSQRRMQMALHALDSVSEPPRPAPGALIGALPSQLTLLVEWWRAFEAEAEPGGGGGSLTDAAVRSRIAAGEVYVWEHEGRPRSLVGVNPVVAGTVRVGPVYTPPDQRRRGFAGSAVAAVSRRALAGGAERCMLFTDLANPTSNRIYASIGYAPFADWEEYALVRTSPAGRSGAGSGR